MNFVELIELMARIMEAIGVGIIVAGALYAAARFLLQFNQTAAKHGAYSQLRIGVAQAILLGLEFLVAGDIIRTVAIEPTFANVGVLALIVLIRTFLSLELTLEIEGRWPWQQAAEAGDGTIEANASGGPEPGESRAA